MTNKEAIEFAKEQLEIFGKNSTMYEFLEFSIKALEERPKSEWIPINSIEDIPKDRMLFVTLDNGYVETLYYDMTEWSDNEYVRHAVAYMDYWEYQPMPYRGDL